MKFTQSFSWILLVSMLLLLFPLSSVHAGDVTLAWDANTEPDLAGYKLYYGNASRSYTTTVNLGNTTTYTVTGLPSGLFFFAVTAYNTAQAESTFSNEVSQTIGQPPTDTTPPVITSLAATGITSNSALISWITNEAADSIVDFGTSVSYGSSTALDSGLVTIHSRTLSGLTPGVLYHYRVRSEDASGNLAVSNDATFSTASAGDLVSPQIAFTSPVSAATYSTAALTMNIAGTASDNVGVTQVNWVNSRGGSGTATGTTSWSATGITLQSGSNIITVTARDAVGNSGLATLTVTCTPPDATSPTVAFTAPVSATTYSTSALSLNIAGTASDNVGVTQVTWANSRGGSGTATGTTSWSATGITLQSGSNIITVTARDAVGNSGLATLTVTCTPPDATSPTVAYTAPVSTATYSTSALSLNIAGTASDNVGVTQVTWVNSRGGSGTATGTTSWSATGIALLSGSNVITVTARDAVGNSGLATLTVTCTPPDATSPTVAYTAPVSTATYSTSALSLNIAGTASDNVGVTQVTWVNSRGGSGTATGTTSWSATGIALLSGSNVLTVTARDAVGNSGLATLTVTCTPPDATSPTVAYTAPVSTPTYSTSALSLNIAGTASDNVGVTQVTWVNSRGGSGTATGTTSWSATGITLQSGSNIITVTARDAVGNSGLATLTVTCTPPDATSPTVAFTAPVSTATYSSSASSLNIAGTASDNVGITQVTWANDRGGSGTATGTVSWSVTGVALQSGSNIITVTARDAAGNTGSATLTVTRATTDQAAPTVSITSPVTASTYSTSTPSLNLAGTASDNVGVAQITWTNSRGGSGTATGTTSWSATGITLLSGSNVITVTARDAAGNSGSDKLTVTFTPPDTAPPVISGVSVVKSTTTATVYWTTNEAADTQVEYGRSTSFGNSTVLNGILVTSHSQVLTGLTADTQHYFRVRSRNASGSLAVSQNFTFKTIASSKFKRLSYPSLSLLPSPSHSFLQESENPAGAEEFTAVAVSNFDSSAATLTFTAFDKNGAEIQGENITNPVTKEIQPGEQLPAIDFQLFGNGLAEVNPPGQIRVDSTTDKLVGLFLAFDSAHSTMDGAELSSAPLTFIVLPEIGDQESSTIILNNPDPGSVTATIDLLYSDGRIRASVERTISGNGTLKENVYSEMFTGTTYDPSDYLRVYANRGLLSYMSFRRQTQDIAIVEGRDASSQADMLYSPQYVVGGPYRTTLSIINLDPIGGTVTLRLLANDASQVGDTRVLPIMPGGKIYVSDQTFFGNALGSSAENFVDGYVEVTSNGIHLTGSVVFEDANNKTFLAALPLAATFYRSLVFSHVASNDAYFTGLAIINPNDTAAVAKIDLYNNIDPAPAATITYTIPAKQRVCRLLTELFPSIQGQDWHAGYFRVTVDQEVAAFALFATWDLKVLSAIPAQPTP